MNTDNDAAKWATALIAPWAVAPHQNFGTKSADVIERLALVADFRYLDERERYSPELHGWEATLIRSAEESLHATTQSRATDELWELASTDSLKPGARAAAAVFGSLGLAEMERADEASRRLKVLVDTLRPELRTDSARLLLAVLAQQRVLRLFDSAQYTEAKAAVEDVMRLFPAEPIWDEDFAVSKGISWDARTVQSDVLASILQDALEARSALEFPSGTGWMDVVRARPGWVDIRQAYRTAERDSIVLRDAFEKHFESTRGTVHMGRTTALETGFAALLLAELAGNTQLARRNREQLGRVTMVADLRDEASGREVIRLFRQSGQARPLQSALNWMRDAGPTSAIATDALHIIERSLRSGWTTELDLLVLETAADFLSARDRAAGIRAAILALTTESISGRVDWSLHEKVWRAVLRLLPDTSAHDAVAREVSTYLRADHLLVEPLVSTLERLVRAVEWNQVDEAVVRAWSEWAREFSSDDSADERRSLARAVLEKVHGQANGMPQEAGVWQAAYLLDQEGSHTPSPEVITANGAALIESLEADASQAAHGIRSFGGPSSANIAVAFAARYGGDDLWAAVVDYLTNADIDRSLKSDAIDRLAAAPHQLPGPFAARLRADFDAVLHSTTRFGLFASEELPEFAAAIRLGSVLGAIDQEAGLGAVMRMAAGQPTSRIEAARCVPFIQGEDATWAHSFLLQMTHDPNPLVSAEAGHALVVTLHRGSSLSRMAELRCEELLLAEGVRRPLRMMQAIRAEARQGRVQTKFAKPLRHLRVAATSRVVRESAAMTLDLSGGA